ncbi:hypothetical protein V8E53_009116 [Lactarius tabidus]
MLYSRFPDKFLVELFGVWEPMKNQLNPALDPACCHRSGVAYYRISPPRTLRAALVDSTHTVLYILFMTRTTVTVCTIFSKT